MMHATVREQLERGPLANGIDADIEANLLTALTTGLGQYVLDHTMTANEAYATIDYHLDRAFLQTDYERPASD